MFGDLIWKLETTCFCHTFSTLLKKRKQMVRVGEESGYLDTMLAKVGEIYDKEVQANVKRLLTLLEPVLIVGLGILVAGIIISIIVPILAANELVI